MELWQSFSGHAVSLILHTFGSHKPCIVLSGEYPIDVMPRVTKVWASGGGIRRITAHTLVAVLSAEGIAFARHDIRLEAEIPPEHSRSHVPAERAGESINVFVSVAASGAASTETWRVVPEFPAYWPSSLFHPTSRWEDLEELERVFPSEPLALGRGPAKSAGHRFQRTLADFNRRPGLRSHCLRYRAANRQKRFLFNRP